MGAPPLVTGLRALFLILGLAMVATLVYTIAIDGLPFRLELLTPWMAATLVDFYTVLTPIMVWVVYKEGNAFTSAIWVILLICFGSIATSFYVFLQLLKLSPQESAQDTMYHLLLRDTKEDPLENKRKHFPVVIARIVFCALGFLMMGTLLYTIVTDGSPFRKELLTPWMNATLVDFYINITALSVWVIYKEPTWISGLIRVVFMICLGGVSTSIYVAKELFQLTSQDPLYLVLLNNRNRKQV